MTNRADSPPLGTFALSPSHFDCDRILHREGKSLGLFRKTWKAAYKKAGVTDRIPYDLRRTAVRNMIQAGVPENVAMSISGHKTRVVFDRYFIVNEEARREALTKTSAYVQSRPSHQQAEVVEIEKGEVAK